MSGRPDSDLFARLVDLGSLLAFEHRLQLREVLGEPAYAVDVARGTVRLVGKGGRAIETRLHLLGTAAPVPGTWLWSWANPGGLPASVTELARRLRAYGEEHGVPEFTASELPLEGERTTQRLGVAAGLALRSPRTLLPAPVDGGTVALLLVDDLQLALPAPTLAGTRRVLEEGAAAVELRSHSAALTRYAQDRGIALDWNGGAPVLRLPDGRIDVRLDHTADRIVGLESSAA